MKITVIKKTILLVPDNFVVEEGGKSLYRYIPDMSLPPLERKKLNGVDVEILEHTETYNME